MITIILKDIWCCKMFFVKPILTLILAWSDVWWHRRPFHFSRRWSGLWPWPLCNHWWPLYTNLVDFLLNLEHVLGTPSVRDIKTEHLFLNCYQKYTVQAWKKTVISFHLKPECCILHFVSNYLLNNNWYKDKSRISLYLHRWASFRYYRSEVAVITWFMSL